MNMKATARMYVAEGLLPPLGNRAIPTLTDAQAAEFLRNRGLAGRVVGTIVRERRLDLPDTHREELEMEAEVGMMNGIRAWAGPEEDVAGRIRFAALCGRREARKRLNRMQRLAEAGFRRVRVSDTGDQGGAARYGDEVAYGIVYQDKHGEAKAEAAAEALAALPADQREIVASHFGIGRDAESDTQIGLRMGLSKKQVFRRRTQALAALQEAAAAGAFDY